LVNLQDKESEEEPEALRSGTHTHTLGFAELRLAYTFPHGTLCNTQAEISRQTWGRHAVDVSLPPARANLGEEGVPREKRAYLVVKDGLGLRVVPAPHVGVGI